jgi:hypothetical protein
MMIALLGFKGSEPDGFAPGAPLGLDEDQDEPHGRDGASANAERDAAARPRHTPGEGTGRDAGGHHDEAMIGTRQPVQETGVEGSMARMGESRGGEGRERSEGR